MTGAQKQIGSQGSSFKTVMFPQILVRKRKFYVETLQTIVELMQLGNILSFKDFAKAFFHVPVYLHYRKRPYSSVQSLFSITSVHELMTI